MKEKQNFEAYSRKQGVIIIHYHADNGIFSDNSFINSVNIQGEKISCCVVNDHFQNVIAGKRIRDFQEQARKQILRAKSIWSSAIELNLLPSAL